MTVKDILFIAETLGLEQIQYVKDEDGNEYVIAQDPITESNICFMIGVSPLEMYKKLAELRERFEADNLRKRAYKRMEKRWD